MAMKLMIVDDDREFGDELAVLLQHAGYEVETFVDGVTAFNEVQRVKPAVILLDLKMDRLSGNQVAWYLRLFEGTATIPIIGMSGYEKDGDPRQIAVACGMNDFLKKPFSSADIITRIEQLAGMPMAETTTVQAAVALAG